MGMGPVLAISRIAVVLSGKWVKASRLSLWGKPGIYRIRQFDYFFLGAAFFRGLASGLSL
jgi:hypothetical protein